MADSPKTGKYHCSNHKGRQLTGVLSSTSFDQKMNTTNQESLLDHRRAARQKSEQSDHFKTWRARDWCTYKKESVYLDKFSTKTFWSSTSPLPKISWTIKQHCKLMHFIFWLLLPSSGIERIFEHCIKGWNFNTTPHKIVSAPTKGCHLLNLLNSMEKWNLLVPLHITSIGKRQRRKLTTMLYNLLVWTKQSGLHKVPKNTVTGPPNQNTWTSMARRVYNSKILW